MILPYFKLTYSYITGYMSTNVTMDNGKSIEVSNNKSLKISVHEIVVHDYIYISITLFASQPLNQAGPR